MLTRFNLSFLFIVFCTSLSAQKMDSIKLEKLKAAAEIYDSTGYEAVIDLGGYYYSQHDQKNLRCYLLKEIEHAEHSGDKEKIGGAYFHTVLYHQAFSGKDSVFEVSQVLLDFFEKDTSKLAGRYRIKALIQIGANFYFDYDDNERAYKYYRMAQEEALKMQDRDQYASIAKELSSMYNGQKRYKDAIGIIDTAFLNLERFPRGTIHNLHKINLSYQKAVALNALADSTVSRQDIFMAYQDKLNYAERNSEKVSVSNVITRMLEGFRDYLPLDTLLVLGEKAIKVEKSGRNSSPNLYLEHSKSLMKAERYQEAKNHLNVGLEQALKRTEWYGPIKDMYDLLTQIYLKEENTKAAESSYTQYKIYQDSFVIDNRKDELEKITTNYELDKKKTENIVLKKQAETLNSRARFLTIIGALLLSLLGVVFYFFQKTRSQAKKMEKLNETKNKIFAILAHDLKGPSLIFNNLAKKLNFLVSKNDTNRLLEMAEYYEESGRKVSRTINNVLNWAIAEKDSFINNPEKIEISPILYETVDDFKFELEQKNIKIALDVTDDANILFDKNAFQIINRNLVHNAIKFAPLDSTINIKFDKQTNAIEYIDVGKGFDSTTAERIMQALPVKSSEGTLNEKGTGIGLATCVNLLKQNRSKLEIENMTPIGTKIKLLFHRSSN